MQRRRKLKGVVIGSHHWHEHSYVGKPLYFRHLFSSFASSPTSFETSRFWSTSSSVLHRMCTHFRAFSAASLSLVHFLSCRNVYRIHFPLRFVLAWNWKRTWGTQKTSYFSPTIERSTKCFQMSPLLQSLLLKELAAFFSIRLRLANLNSIMDVVLIHRYKLRQHIHGIFKPHYLLRLNILAFQICIPSLQQY